MLTKSVLAAALLALSVGAAMAAKSGPLTATLAAAPARGEVIASSIIWRCDGTACATASDTSGASAANACRSLVKQLGAVTAFSSAKGAFDAAQLAKCNGTAQ